MGKQVDLNDIPIFVAVARAGTLNAAAKELHVTYIDGKPRTHTARRENRADADPAKPQRAAHDGRWPRVSTCM